MAKHCEAHLSASGRGVLDHRLKELAGHDDGLVERPAEVHHVLLDAGNLGRNREVVSTTERYLKGRCE